MPKKQKTPTREIKKPRRPPDDDDEVVTSRNDEEESHDVVDARERKKKKKKQRREEEDDEEEESEGKKAKKESGVKDVDGHVRHRLSKKVAERQVVDLRVHDKRKFKGKAKQRLEAWKGDQSRIRDAWQNAVMAGARKKLGHSSVFVGRDTDALLIGIPMYAGYDKNAAKYPGCLPLEFVLAQDVFPLSVIVQLVAKAGVGKSGLVAEFGRWFDIAGGVVQLNENESKFNPKWYISLMGRERYDRMVLNRCKDVEDWQAGVSAGLKDTKLFMRGSADEPGPGPTFPYMQAVDSIMGKMSRKSQEKILGKKSETGSGMRGETGEGYAGRGFPEEALVITRYLKSIAGEYDNWPFALVLVNHLKINTDDMGNEERSKGGGKTVDFQESFELELEKVGGTKKKIECRDWEGYQVRLSCYKNSFGPGNRSITTRILWWEEEDDQGNWEQRTVWDWDWSTVWLLNNILRGEKSSPRLRQSLKDAEFHLECPGTSDIENSAWSKNLGMRAKDAVPWSDLGAMIRKDAKLQDLLRKALRINRRPLLKGDYVEQLSGLSESLP